MNSRFRKKLYPVLVNRDGEECAICGKVGNKNSLVIDHRDNINSHNEPDNLQLLCRSCNGKKNPRGKGKKQSPMYVRGDEYQHPKEPSPELKKSERCEPIFRTWLEETISQRHLLSVYDVITGGAEKAGCAQATVNRYLQKVCSIVGNFEYFENAEQQKCVRFKPEYAAKIKGDEKKTINEKVIPLQNISTGT